MPLPFPRYVPFGNHPTVQHALGHDMRGVFWIHCRCTACGPAADFVKACSFPPRGMNTVAVYARQHSH